MQETQEEQVQSLGWEGPLEKEMETHSSILACKIPRTEEPGGLQSMELQRVRHDQVTEHTHSRCIHENSAISIKISVTKTSPKHTKVK